MQIFQIELIFRLTDQIEAMGSSLDSRDLLMLKKSSKISHRRRRKSSVSINQHLSTNFESSYSDDHLIPTLIVNGQKKCWILNLNV